MDSVKRILFCFYPLHVRYNHGIALLSALCKARGIEVELCLLEDLNRFSAVLYGRRYDHIGFSCVSNQDYWKSLPFIAAAKSFGYSILIGGPYGPGIELGNDILVCRGEAERLPDFILNGDRSLFDKQQVCQDINILPLPDYELFKYIPFDRQFPFSISGKKILPYFTSRGCPLNCEFCLTAHRTKNMYGGRVRVRKRVEQDLTEIRDQYQPDIFYIADALIPYYSEAWRKSWGKFRHPFMGYIRADILPETLEWLIDRGMIACAFGVESGDEKFRNDVMKKRLSDDQIFRTIDILKSKGVEYAPFYIKNYPQESFKSKLLTYEMADKVGGYPVFWEYEKLF